MKILKTLFLIGTVAVCFGNVSLAQTQKNPKVKPIQLFNGKDIKDWTPKIRHQAPGVNYANTFRVEDGLMKVRYDGYGEFNQQYGHIAYHKPFGYYVLRVTYRFVDEQAKGGEGWAWRNSGAMLHGQSPQTMTKDQDFPISIEGQFLGGDGTNARSTSNLCTPGTNVVMNDKLFTPHCISSTSKTFHGEQWVTADFVVLGDSLIQHVMNEEVVLSYTKPQIGGGNVESADPKEKTDGKALTSGYIYLQSESHPIDFKQVELYDLEAYKNNPAILDKLVKEILAKKK